MNGYVPFDFADPDYWSQGWFLYDFEQELSPCGALLYQQGQGEDDFLCFYGANSQLKLKLPTKHKQEQIQQLWQQSFLTNFAPEQRQAMLTLLALLFSLKQNSLEIEYSDVSYWQSVNIVNLYLFYQEVLATFNLKTLASFSRETFTGFCANWQDKLSWEERAYVQTTYLNYFVMAQHLNLPFGQAQEQVLQQPMRIYTKIFAFCTALKQGKWDNLDPGFMDM
ncbi:hypothetical protein CJP74_00325 [Psittacicella melopsittaci]|uniref:Uncharacterized protein n=1 Tax=Psittacicella melopsittaci TaxID=2028576 RepID=A0A3A1YA26_9GAMM|nr:hypothetical protein [Psittacicella melopsittaci]RIY34060.1 hypothetical protein CJP74_00325 [Psittacicella melopsittaci]